MIVSGLEQLVRLPQRQDIELGLFDKIAIGLVQLTRLSNMIAFETVQLLRLS